MPPHQKYMLRCVELAKNALGNTYPNPIVGSVIVYNDEIIGEGYHTQAGEPHAEVNAINSVKNKSLLSKSTIYVSLEPCSHYGKTPPCAKLIAEKKIPSVVIGTIDTTAKVSGKGIKILEEAGSKVTVGILEKECRELNKRFFTFHEKKRPYVILKWAQTLDGFIDLERTADMPIQPNWITNETCRTLVHKWRSEEQAIMVGTNTVEKDNPKLDVRNWTGKNPIRVLIDRNLRLSRTSHLFDNTIPTICFTEQNLPLIKEKLHFIKINFEKDILAQILNELHKLNIQSIIIEGGAMLLNSFIKAKMWDEARIFYGNKLFEKGTAAPKISGIIKQEAIINDNIVKILYC